MVHIDPFLWLSCLRVSVVCISLRVICTFWLGSTAARQTPFISLTMYRDVYISVGDVFLFATNEFYLVFSKQARIVAVSIKRYEVMFMVKLALNVAPTT